jgi:Probable zinc-ribbon domain
VSGKSKKPEPLTAPEMPDNVVPHTHYGVKVKASVHTLTTEDLRFLRTLKPGTFWPETAIPAGRSADRYGSHLLYVDRLCRCIECFRPFVFYAQEQRFWVEALGFHPDSTATRCTECRRTVRKVKQRRDRIEEHLRDLKDRPGALTRGVLTDKALLALTIDLLALVECGAIKKLDLLKRLRRAMFDRVDPRTTAEMQPLIKRIDKLAGPVKRRDLAHVDA